jgi:hypothetical protein
MARYLDVEVVEQMPDMVLVLVKASPEVIRQRMRDNSGPWRECHAKSLLQDRDVEFVLDRFQEEYNSSLIPNRFTLDTTSATPDETLKVFTQKIDAYLTPRDRLRIITHQMK